MSDLAVQLTFLVDADLRSADLEALETGFTSRYGFRPIMSASSIHSPIASIAFCTSGLDVEGFSLIGNLERIADWWDVEIRHLVADVLSPAEGEARIELAAADVRTMDRVAEGFRRHYPAPTVTA